MISRMIKWPVPDVSIVIGTYGSSEWDERGQWLAEKTHQTQLIAQTEVIHVHADTLAEARNRGADEARAPWLVFLDADDFLDDYYSFQIGQQETDANVLVPSVRGFKADWVGVPPHGYTNWRWIEDEPVMPQKRTLLQQNFLPCGAPITMDLFEMTGGFEEWPVLEDWAFWLSAEKTGDLRMENFYGGVYQINDDHQRNKHPEINRVAIEIRNKYR